VGPNQPPHAAPNSQYKKKGTGRGGRTRHPTPVALFWEVFVCKLQLAITFAYELRFRRATCQTVRNQKLHRKSWEKYNKWFSACPSWNSKT
jgi:hypothetical protein